MRKLLDRSPYSKAINRQQIERHIAEIKAEAARTKKRRKTTIVESPPAAVPIPEMEQPEDIVQNNDIYQDLVNTMNLVVLSKSEPEKKTRSRRTKKSS